MERKRRVFETFLIVLALTGSILSIGYTVRKKVSTAAAIPVKFEATAARLERGRYLVEGPAHCFSVTRK